METTQTSPPPAAATTSAPAPRPAPAPEPAAERIVSVNDYGGGARGAWRKLVLAALAVALLGGAVLLSLQRARAYLRAKSETQSAAQRQAAGAAQAGRRIFPPPSPASAPAGSAATAAAETPPAVQACADKLPSEPMRAQDGSPILTPTGLPVRVCHDGQILIPPLPLPAMPSPPWPPTAAPQAGTVPAAATAPASRYGGDILLPPPGAGAGTASGARPLSGEPAAAGYPAAAGDGAASPHGPLKAMLRATPVTAVQAERLGDRHLILPQGRTIDCNLSLRVVSDVSGMAVCVLSSYVYGDSGVVVLAEPGSVATGDYLAFTAQGQRRLFITWTRLKTTRDVVINLNSPASDALGTSGVDGYVDNRWADRIGAAVLLSTVQDAIGYQTARAGAERDGGGVAVFPNTTAAGSRLAERILDSTINIKPTIYKHQGDRASITVARDLDFGSVYALRTQ